MTTSTANAQTLGINVGQTFSDKQLYDALIKEYNAKGGVAGRKIVPVYGKSDTSSADWSTQFQAICQTFTQDNHVQAVLGYVFVFLDSFEQCLAGNGVPHLYGGYQPGDVQAQREFPSLFSVMLPTVDVVSQIVLEGAMASGRLTTHSKFGILYDGCGHGDRAFRESTEPYLKQHGIHYETAYVACSKGEGDTGNAAAAVQSAELRFAANGVDVVYVTSGVALVIFMNTAESQRYRPSYIFPGGGAAAEAQSSVSPAQMRNLHAYGVMPRLDVNATHQPYANTREEVACLAKLKHQGLVPSGYMDFLMAYVTCNALELYARALEVTGGSTRSSEVRDALMRVMPTFRSAGTYDGAFEVSLLQRGGPGRYRESGWTDACSCFTYRGPVRTVPTS